MEKGLSVAGIKYVVEHNYENRSIKSIIKREYSISSRFLSKLKQEDLIRLNGKPAKNWYTPKAGDVIELVMPKAVILRLIAVLTLMRCMKMNICL